MPTAATTADSEGHPDADERKKNQSQVRIVDFHTDCPQYGADQRSGQ